MKILMVVYQFMPVYRGGAEMQCWLQARALAARGHEVSILTPWLGGSTARKEILDGVVIRRLGFFLPVTMRVRRIHQWLRRKLVPPAAERADPFSADRACAATPRRRRFRFMAPVEWLGNFSFIAEAALFVGLHRISADVVHVHESHWIASFGQWLGTRMGVPVFCKEAMGKVLQWPGPRDVPGRERWKPWRLKCRYLALTGHIREELVKAGIPDDRIEILPNGVEIPSGMARPAEHSRAVYAGNFTQGSVYKGFDILLQAWGRVHAQEPTMRLVMYGGGDATRWKLFAAQHGCGDSVEFAGRTERLADEFLRAGFLVLPSRVEGMSNVLLEAQAAGLPAVVSDIPGNLAVVRNGETGLAVPVGDAEALAQAMVRLFRAPELRAQLGRAARARVAEHFAVEKIVARLEEVYAQALASRPLHP